VFIGNLSGLDATRRANESIVCILPQQPFGSRLNIVLRDGVGLVAASSSAKSFKSNSVHEE
jgi:hypothetical protein